MQITAKYLGNEYQLAEAGIAEFVAFERAYGVSSSVFSNQNAEHRLEWMAFLVFRLLIRAGVLPKDAVFDDALAGIEEIRFPEEPSADDLVEVGEPDPTVPAPAPTS